MMRTMLLAALAAALAVPAAGFGGGFATVQLGSLPTGTAAGGTWSAELTILRHGRTPLDGLVPVVRVTDEDGAAISYEARPTGAPGRYAVDVRFPHRGTWAWEIWDGYTQTHTYAPVAIGAPADDGPPAGPVAVALVGALALVGVACAGALVARGRRTPVVP